MYSTFVFSISHFSQTFRQGNFTQLGRSPRLWPPDGTIESLVSRRFNKWNLAMSCQRGDRGDRDCYGSLGTGRYKELRFNVDMVLPSNLMSRFQCYFG